MVRSNISVQVSPVDPVWEVFERLESNVRAYCRQFPAIMTHAKGATIRTEDGRLLLDFLSGAGTLNYGHNPDPIKAALLEYLGADGIVHGLDLATPAKRDFMELFDSSILQPRGLKYKCQFPGPTGTNAVEAALKLARRITHRHNVIAFTNAFHGVTLGAVAATGNRYFRGAAFLPAFGVTFMPYDGYLGQGTNTASYIRKLLRDSSSGIDLPAAIILETVQGEGGINVAGFAWLREIEKICREFDAMLIIDDIQMGCGRTGAFFSFTDSEIEPDLVVLSKSLSGYGLPLSMLLVKPEFDLWKPGEHNGTFRGNNLALVAAAATLRKYWENDLFASETRRKGAYMLNRVKDIASRFSSQGVSARGRGMVVGLDCGTNARAAKLSQMAFEKGLIIERCGPEDEVLKLIPPLTISDAEIDGAFTILDRLCATSLD